MWGSCLSTAASSAAVLVLARVLGAVAGAGAVGATGTDGSAGGDGGHKQCGKGDGNLKINTGRETVNTKIRQRVMMMLMTIDT